MTVENLTQTQIPRANFTVYFFDKNKVRIGQGMLTLTDLDAGQSAKMQFQFNSVGIPASLTLSAKEGHAGRSEREVDPSQNPFGSIECPTVQVEGKELSYPRNQVKKLMLVERVIQQNPTIVQPGASSSK